ncbi:MAG: class I SAM-dependent methyltransferase [Promethearchaeota archaeon]
MQLHPKKILQPKKFLEHQKGTLSREMVNIVVNLINKPGLKILDVGGASGVFLNEIIKKSKFNIDPLILEVDDYYKKRIVNPNITFLEGSILDRKIEENSYDIVIFDFVLHHIVSRNLKKTYLIQQLALQEIFRIVKRGGFVVFREEVNNIRTFSWIIYLFSRIINKLKIKIKFLDIDKVVVHFLTKKELIKIFDIYKKHYGLIIRKKSYQKWGGLKWKLMLFFDYGCVFYLLRVKK